MWTRRFPLYTPGPRPDGLTATIKLLGTVLDAPPLAAPTTNQFPLGGELVEAVIEYETDSPVLVTTMFCEGPGWPGCVVRVEVKLMEVGRFSRATVLMLRVTGMLSAGAPGAVSWIEPVYVPGARFPGFTATVKVVGVVEELGRPPINNQLMPLLTPLPVTVNDN